MTMTKLTNNPAKALSRREFTSLAAGGFLVSRPWTVSAAALDDQTKFFVAEAQRMKELAIANGDQAYGAIIVKNNKIVGYGPSRVVVDQNRNAHAERVALWDAQKRLARKDLPGCVVYSTSRPCVICEEALVEANIEKMFYGPNALENRRLKTR
jgi:tRNA(Arg) A34 adenosine deaminase TadA